LIVLIVLIVLIGGTMETLRLVVVSAGLSQPSSTRLLADRLTRAVRTRLVEDGRTAELSVI
jgi:FMN reductase